MQEVAATQGFRMGLLELFRALACEARGDEISAEAYREVAWAFMTKRQPPIGGVAAQLEG